MSRRQARVDPAVLAIVSQGDQRRQQGARKRRAREDERAKVTLRLAPQVASIIKAVAEREGTSQAGVVDLFVASALRGYMSDEVRFDENTRESRSPRQDWVVEVVELDVLQRELDEFLEARNVS